jgi:hypothetical protein
MTGQVPVRGQRLTGCIVSGPYPASDAGEPRVFSADSLPPPSTLLLNFAATLADFNAPHNRPTATSETCAPRTVRRTDPIVKMGRAMMVRDGGRVTARRAAGGAGRHATVIRSAATGYEHASVFGRVRARRSSCDTRYYSWRQPRDTDQQAVHSMFKPLFSTACPRLEAEGSLGPSSRPVVVAHLFNAHRGMMLRSKMIRRRLIARMASQSQ